MRTMVGRLIGACFALAVLGVPVLAAGPSPVSSRDAHEVRAVIEAQLKAMAEDDAVRAFSYASPSVRKRFGDAPTFMMMVREGYPMLIHPEAMLFLKPEAVINGIRQVVHVRDEEGTSWLATYHVQRQKDKSWRINGCVVKPDQGDLLSI
jgi:Domain of unknown function (DUF4864)